jgi:hypothetical protein
MKSRGAKSKAVEFMGRNRKGLLGVIAGLGFLNVVLVAASYLIFPGYLDHGEPGMALISWRLLDGIPAYLGFDTPALVSNVYGPLTYSSQALSFWLFGSSILAGKAMSFLAAALIPVFVFLSQRHRGFEAAAAGTVFVSALMLYLVPFSIWTRPESLMAVLGVIAVWAANASDPKKPEWGKSAVIAVTAALAVGMKLHAGIYFAPVVIFHCLNENRGFKTFAAMAGAGLIVVLLPFAFSVFPISDFWTWIFHHLKKDSPSHFFIKYIRYGFIYASPVLFFLAASRWSGKSHLLAEKVYFSLFLACLIVTFFPATKVGAGTYYYYPFLAVLIDQILRHAVRVKKHKEVVWGLLGVMTAILLVTSIPVQKRFYRALHWQEVAAVQSEIRAIMAAYPERTIEMGIGQDVRTYPRTFYRTLLVMAGHPYTIDAAPAMEMTMWKIPLSDDLLSMMRGCNTDIWLIPKDEKPFQMTGYYGVPTLDRAFVDTFLASYTKLNSFDYFDVWACNK